jgi:hypothetical protein
VCDAKNNPGSLEGSGESFPCRWLSICEAGRSHRSYTKAGISRPMVIPTYDEIPVSVIRNNLKTAGISRDEYFRLLEKK